jgi:hypothetical protein
VLSLPVQPLANHWAFCLNKKKKNIRLSHEISLFLPSNSSMMKSIALGVVIAALLACVQGQFKQFFSTTSPSSYLPAFNKAAGAGNPYRGINTSPWFYAFGPKENIPYSIDFYYLPLNKIMIGNPATLGDAAFNKTYIENVLQGSHDRGKHVIPRVYLECPGQATGVPQFLIDGGLKFSYSGDKVSKSPDYNDTNLHNALQKYIAWFGKNYDGDYRIAFIELRLLGFLNGTIFPICSFLTL